MRLCAVAAAVCLLVGAGVQTAAAGGEPTATRGDSVDADDADDADDVPVALSISPKRALVSLAFLGAIAARNRRTPT
ncbi:hypothetical protein [Halobacterium sp. CBA1126]|uniref:hypothetical protein n=1 Tax=Halobacterium TaxID=2239 RepID=UPI0012FBEB7A|nr:hypothetical protein [Halobacterium sp. CBA1126]MUV61322.1 hypothetical protein [Halobacterium sp. CBA1126]